MEQYSHLKRWTQYLYTSCEVWFRICMTSEDSRIGATM